MSQQIEKVRAQIETTRAKLASAGWNAMEMNRRTVPLPVWFCQLIDSITETVTELESVLKLLAETEPAPPRTP